MMNKSKRALILVGDLVEELEFIVPFFAMEALGMDVMR
jgi:putative intracellular protease/amidase